MWRTAAGHNLFITKLDPLGNVIYSTYFGGSGDDSPTAMAVDPSGNVYVTGTLYFPGVATASEFPTTKGAYATTLTSGPNNFLFKLNSDGTLGYSTYFPAGQSSPAALAVDNTGSVYLSGPTNGGLPTTPGANKTTCGCSFPAPGSLSGTHTNLGIFFTDAFLTKFDSTGSTLVFSTYLGLQSGAGKALAIAPDGSSYIALAGTSLFHMNATGSAQLEIVTPTLTIAALAVAPDGTVYLAGSPFVDEFKDDAGGSAAHVLLSAPAAQIEAPPGLLRFDAHLKTVLAATYIGSPYGSNVLGLTVDSAEMRSSPALLLHAA